MAETDNDEQPIPLPEEEDRPTLGARIAGLMQPSYMPGGSRAMPAPIDNSPAPDVKPALDMSKMPDAVKMLTGPASIPTPPTGSNNPQLADLARKQATLSTPINPVDPTTHKTKPEYRMGIGQRILGTIANAATGFEGRGGDAVRVGPGATNNRYAREEAQRQGELSGVNTQIGTQEKLDATNNKLYDLATKQAYDIQRGEAAQETASAREESAKNRGLYEQSQVELNRAKTNAIDNKETPEPKTETEIALAYQTALLKGDKANAAKYKGALDELRQQKAAGREPRQPSELDSWMSAFKRDNGRAPTADEIANRKSHTSSKADQIEKDKDTAMQKAEDKASKRIKEVSDITKPDLSDPFRKGESLGQRMERRKQAVYDDLEKEKAQIQKEYETRAAQNAGARPASQPAAKASAGNYQLGQVVNVKGKGRGKIVGINPTTKKPIVDYSGQ